MAVRYPLSSSAATVSAVGRLVAGKQAGGVSRDDPRAGPVGPGVIADRGGGHDTISEFHSHRSSVIMHGMQKLRASKPLVICQLHQCDVSRRAAIPSLYR